VIRWLIWLGFVLAWTIALELPVPETADLPGGEVIATNKFLFTNSVHVAAFAVMAILSGWTPLAPRYRWVMMFFLMLHAWGSEYLQELLHSICFRGGKLEDVGFDVIGILLGVAASWKLWTAVPSDQIV
jgi:hypothetical protein